MVPFFSFCLQEPVTSVMMNMSSLHDMLLILLLSIMITVFFLGAWSSSTLFFAPSVSNPEVVEVVWTLVPVFCLAVVGVPSLTYLFVFDAPLFDNSLTIKTMGHQWYWSYEYQLLAKSFEFDSYMTPLSEEGVNGLDVDHRVVVPHGEGVRMVVGSSDVLHSWALPSFCTKVDAVPGRLSELFFNPLMVGSFYGQCSELCGVNHSFMPICTEVIPKNCFDFWVNEISL